ncbi:MULTISPECIES: SCO3374 family protein [unclassified Streptomyces]|uniref:SCO3374 family protein n=1 Tax=unclassified Streptomyces TaxID=2593676 RepID=UPI002DDA48A8|nr:SCO3374 family protein [Streptomyces sp. NBC_00243]WRZ20760.1 SCO3374 family protein [Streptomyces sp. NBC_00243]
MVHTVPLPRRPLDDPSDAVQQWYENELGWATVPGAPVRLATGLRFDVLDVPAEAGYPALRHLGTGSPVALHRGPRARGERMRFLVAAGSADELPGLLDWLEWGTLTLDLRAIGAGGSIEAPPPPAVRPPGMPEDSPGPGCSQRPGTREAGPRGPGMTEAGPRRPGTQEASPQGAAVWLRPPEPGCEVEPSLPTLSAFSALPAWPAVGGVGGAPDLVRLVDTMATQCHRVRLRRACAQPLAFS